MRVWGDTPTTWAYLPLQIRPGERRFRTVTWRFGCQLWGRYVGVHIGWRMCLQDIRNLVTGLAIRWEGVTCQDGASTAILGFSTGLARMEYWITGKPLGGRKEIDDPIGRGFIAKVFRSKTS